MALTIRRGTTRAFLISLEDCSDKDYLWNTFDNTFVRLKQGNYYVDKTLSVIDGDPTAGLVLYSEKETLPFVSEKDAELQVCSIKETEDYQVVLKSGTFKVAILPSLWDNELANSPSGALIPRVLIPQFPNVMGHGVFDTLHISIKEYSGIISETGDIILQGESLVYDSETETISAE